MIRGQSVLGLITARGGSKRLPGKNIRPFGGRPLLVWTIEAAKACAGMDRLIISSDDAAILETARQAGCEVPFVRPAGLSGDHASSVDVAVHAVEALAERYDWLVLLQPTSPLRTGADIEACLNLALDRGAPSCISLTEPEKSPYVMFRLDAENDRLTPLLRLEGMDLQHARSQDFPRVHEINGAVFAVRTQYFLEHRSFFDDLTVGYVMPRNRSVNIDTLDDFLLGEAQVALQRAEQP
jgi:N-acylneuraminate cytidylyltransferase